MKNKMIRAVILTIISCVILNFTAFANEENYETKYVTAKSGLNLRTEPNTDCEIIKAVSLGTEILIKSNSEKDGWVEGILDDGTIFYVNNQYISDTSNMFYLGQYKITFYCSCSKCCGKWSKYQKTASGTDLVEGVTAACNSLPLGTIVNIDGHNYIIQDQGNMKDNVIDIYVSSHQEALDKGTYYTDIYLVN